MQNRFQYPLGRGWFFKQSRKTYIMRTYHDMVKMKKLRNLVGNGFLASGGFLKKMPVY
jgi:hypothetical protein